MRTISLVLLLAASQVYSAPVSNIEAFYRDGQVFVTWDNVAAEFFTLYRSSTPIMYGHQLSSAENLGRVIITSALNVRTGQYLRIDSASAPLSSAKGLFVATSTDDGLFYYAVTTVSSGSEDTTIIYGSNSISSPVSETINAPKPVWQENRVLGSKTFEVYVWFGTRITSTSYPQMTNAGSYPFNFAIIRSGNQAPHPVRIYMRPGNGHFLNDIDPLLITTDPNEWIISIEDFVPNGGGNLGSSYYGYHEGYDIYSPQNPIPTSDTIYNYTAARITHTLNWALTHLPVDSTRTYMVGYSMGAIGSLLNSMMIPSRIAAVFAVAPRIDVSVGNSNSDLQMWGTYQTNLPTNEGIPRNDRLNVDRLLSINRLNSLPIIYTFCGKNDVNVGWAEKIPFYDSMNVLGHLGFHFWDPHDHSLGGLNFAWTPSFPAFIASFLRYRTNLSYPAFSNCSVNDDPGNGNPQSGDSVGQINGFLDWNDDIVDSTGIWKITLKTKTLVTTFDTLHAPDSCTVDVTLRRLQRFNVVPGDSILWVNTRNNATVQQGWISYSGGPITIPGVKVFRDSNTVSLDIVTGVKEADGGIPGEFTLLQNYPNPFNPSTNITYTLPSSAFVTLKIFNLLGQEVTTLVNEEMTVGNHEVTWDATNMPSGVYFYRLQVGGVSETRKLVLLR